MNRNKRKTFLNECMNIHTMCKISHYSSHYLCCFKAYKYIEKTFVELLKNNKSLRYIFLWQSIMSLEIGLIN